MLQGNPNACTQDRERTRAAATTAAEEGAFYAVKTMEHAARAREEAKAERERLAAEKKLTWNQKEKRKRDAGQASRAKNYVEEVGSLRFVLLLLIMSCSLALWQT